MSLTALEELRRELKRQRSDVMATMLGQKIINHSNVQMLAVIQTAIEAVSAVIASGELSTEHRREGRL